MVTGETYVAMLNNEFLSAAANYPNIDGMWFQHDGAPDHYSIIARNWLDEHFSLWWFGCHGQVEYPSRSPDFFLWGILKNEVYAQKPRTFEQLKEKIVDAYDKITADSCRKVRYSVAK
jgi:hypothetical protein